MKAYRWAFALIASVVFVACSGGKSGGGDFSLIEFLESGQNNIPRNRQIRFRFSQSVAGVDKQYIEGRLRIQNVRQEPGNANFASAAGDYIVNGEIVVFTPRLPTRPDRSDAGFKADGSYHVFLSGGPNGLESVSGDQIVNQQEFLFDTNQYFEDIIPAEPPRSIAFVAADPTLDDVDPGKETDLSRLDPRPFNLAQIDNATLIANGRYVAPGTGDEFGTPWFLDLKLSEPVDPSTVTNATVQMYEIFSDATTPNSAPPTVPAGDFGTPVNFRVAVKIETFQKIDLDGNYDIRIRITPIATLVDNTRYRVIISGEVLGLDFRKTFSGDNGLTGDGETAVDQVKYDEPGGLGYVTEFIVSDHASINASRTLQYDPVVDGINPEQGQTTLDAENGSNSALYNPPAKPGTAVGFLSAFGSGVDGALAVAGATTTTINTGDTPNEPLGNPFSVTDLNPNDQYIGDTLPGGLVEYDSFEPMELELESFTISSSATLRVIGVNPILFRVAGITQIAGILDASGRNGGKGGSSLAAGGESGAGGFDGAETRQGAACRATSGSCRDFDGFLNQCSQAKNVFPASVNGEGPGRGLAGGEAYPYYAVDGKVTYPVGTGGGGASHATAGTQGQDKGNSGGQPGTAGPNCSSFFNVRNAGVIGVRGMPGPVYGDREIIDVNVGGSGGASGGAIHYYTSFAAMQAGGGGGGGGGSVMVVSAGTILAQGAQINVSGGAGGKGGLRVGYSFYSWESVSGAGGGGSGGTLALISGDAIDLTAAVISAAGGAGGLAANAGTTNSCKTCNTGGSGGVGFIFLMDADGNIDGFVPSGGTNGNAGEYDSDSRGIITTSAFDATRFSSITAVTELFPMTTANPAYKDFNELPGDEDIIGFVNDSQTIVVKVSSAKSNPDEPLLPDLTSELTPFDVAMLEYSAGSTVVTRLGDMSFLNADPANPDREAFVRVQASFTYAIGVQAALGPFAAIDSVTISYRFN